MRKPILSTTQLTRRQFILPRTTVSSNVISTDRHSTLADALPYSGKQGFTPTANFYKHPSHETVEVDDETWRLSVSGLVGRSMDMSLDELLKMPSVEMPCTLASITSTPTNLTMGHALWTGVAIQQLFDNVKLNSDAQYAQFRSVNGYTTYLPVNLLENAILAYKMNGEALSAEQGYPVRLIVPGVYDYKMPKWMHAIELVAAPASGHYESRGWSDNGLIQTASAFFTPRHREVVEGKVTFSGMAFAGMRSITRIELSVDDGEWMPVPFAVAEKGSWTRWQIDWMPPAPGDYLVKVRATDSEGFTQSNTPNQPIFPKGTSRIHAVVFRISM